MLRLFATHACQVLRDCDHFVARCVVKRPSGSVPLAGRVRHRLARHLSTANQVGKDATEGKPEETDRLDLDRWKAVMRSQAAFEEKQVEKSEDDDDDDDESLRAAGDAPEEGATLEATRDLVAMWREAGKQVPKEMSDEEVETLAKLATKSSKKKYLKYLAIREGHKLARKEKQKQKKEAREALKKKRSDEEEEEEEEEGDDAGARRPAKNSLFLTFWSRSLDKLLAWRSASAMVFGQPLVFDMSYESNMSKRELDNTVSQLMEVEGWNRRAAEPFHLHLCNLQPGGPYERELLKRYGEEAWRRLLLTSTERRHVDTFPKERLVYLTADSPNVLRSFDHSKVYIVGALVDRSSQPGLSLAHAKRLKLATARLPLDELLHWEIGAKTLTLDQMIRILLAVKDTGEWEEALRFVPQRKHDGFHQQLPPQQQQQRVRSDANPKPKQNRAGGPPWSRDGSGGEAFRSGRQSFPKAKAESMFSARDRPSGSTGERENTPTSTRVRTSLKSNLGARKSAGKNGMWWHNE